MTDFVSGGRQALDWGEPTWMSNEDSGEGAKETRDKHSKVEKEVREETIGNGKFTKKTKIIPGRDPGQSRSEMEFVKNS